MLASVPLITGLAAIAVWIPCKLTLGSTRPRVSVARLVAARHVGLDRPGTGALALADVLPSGKVAAAESIKLQFMRAGDRVQVDWTRVESLWRRRGMLRAYASCFGAPSSSRALSSFNRHE